MKKIIGMGNALVDVLANIDNDNLLTEIGLKKGGMCLIDDEKAEKVMEMFSTIKTHKATGGSARNTMHAMARLGQKTGFIGKTGNDETGRFFQEQCEALGIEMKLLKSDLRSGIAHTFITPDGERTFGTYLGAAALMNAEEIGGNLFDGYDYLYVEGYLVQNHEMIETAMRLAKEKGLKVCLDLASYNIVEGDLDFFHHITKEYVDIVFANEEEARAFTCGKSPDEALEEIGSMCEIAVVKLGAKGAMALKEGTKTVEAGTRVEHVTDTTAAGDFFAGGFLNGLLCGLNMNKCLKMGNIMGENVIQFFGTNIPEERWTEIVKSINEVADEL